MTAPPTPAIGLSVGTSTLVAMSSDRAVTGPPVISRAGVPIDDFVDRVGDPVGIVAADGSRHSAAALLADALYERARAASAGRPLPSAMAVAYPAHWKPVAVQALARALRRVPAWSAGVLLVPDYVAALAALVADPGLPTRGVIAVCDAGAGATTITLVDAAGGVLGEPVRCLEFSGEIVDRALLAHVLAGAGAAPGATGTMSIRVLNRLRADCRAAKEKLSSDTVATVPGDAAGVRGPVRLTRRELDEVVRDPLAEMVAALRDSLRRNGLAPADLVAVASVGGMAAVPAVATTLSEQLRVPVITARRPALAAATGAALLGVGRTVATAITHAGVAPPARAPDPKPLAWSAASDVPEVVPQHAVLAERLPPRPELDFAPFSSETGSVTPAWHRRPLVVAAAVLAVIAGAGAATALALRSGTAAAPAVSVPVPGADSGARAPGDPPSPVGDGPAQPPRTVIAVPAPVAEPATETTLPG